MAKGIDLGLESLLSTNVPTKNFVEDLADFFATSMEVMEQANIIVQAYTTIDTLNGIQNCIRKHGVTQSLETLYGENFRGASSMEEDTAAAKQSIWKRLADMIRKFCAWIKAWVQKFIGTRGRTAKNCKKSKRKPLNCRPMQPLNLMVSQSRVLLRLSKTTKQKKSHSLVEQPLRVAS